MTETNESPIHYAALSLPFGDGVSASGFNKPTSADIFAFTDAVDAAVESLSEKIAAAEADVKPIIALDLATTGNVTLSGEQSIDGTLTSANKVLVRANTDAKQNGPYLTSPGAWARLTDFDTGAELFAQQFFIKGGTANSNKYFGLQNTTVPVAGGQSIGGFMTFSTRLERSRCPFARRAAITLAIPRPGGNTRLGLSLFTGGWPVPVRRKTNRRRAADACHASALTHNHRNIELRGSL